MSTSWKGVAEEAAEAYKDVDEVVRVSHEAGLGRLVARVVPIVVMILYLVVARRLRAFESL